MYAFYCTVPVLCFAVPSMMYFAVFLFQHGRSGDGIVSLGKRCVQGAATATLVLLFVSYPAVCRAVLDVFACHSLDKDNGFEVLLANQSVVCGTPKHESFMQLGYVAMLVYAFGIPNVIFVMLWKRNREERLNDQDSKATLGFMYEGFRKRYYYWEVVIMLRKLVIVMIVVFFQGREFLQVSAKWETEQKAKQNPPQMACRGICQAPRPSRPSCPPPFPITPGSLHLNFNECSARVAHSLQALCGRLH